MCGVWDAFREIDVSCGWIERLGYPLRKVGKSLCLEHFPERFVVLGEFYSGD